MASKDNQHTAGGPTAEGEPVASPITPRAILLGALSVALLAAINPHLAFVARTWSVGDGSLLNSAVFMLFLLVAANGVLARFWPDRALHRSELLVVYGMLIVSVGYLFVGGMPYLVSATTHPFYMATSGNEWEHLIWPYVPGWLSLSSPEAVVWFWEGSPAGVGVPWDVWLTPLLNWFSFSVAMMAAMFCLGALLSRDWIERQRLAFPLVEVPLSLTGRDAFPTLRSSILSNRVFWLGFAVPCALAVLAFLHRLSPSVPSPALWNIHIGRNFAGMGLPWSALSDMRLSLLFPVIGITCMLPSEVSLSLWLFYALYLIQLLVWASFGIAAEGGTSSLSLNPVSFVHYQEAGGFIALSVLIIYQSRSALRRAWWSLLGRDQETHSPYAALAGRWALLGFAAANGFMLWWASRAGMSWWSFGLLMAVFYAVLIGCSRLVAAGGVMFVSNEFTTRGVVLSAVGARAIGAQSLTMYTYVWLAYMADPMSLAMPQMVNSFKLIGQARVRGKLFTLAAGLAVIIMLGVGLPALLSVIHKHGASAIGYGSGWPFRMFPNWAFGDLDAALRDPLPPDNWLRSAMLLGAVITAVLVWLNTRFVWWSLSPIGFLIASSYETNRSLWLNALIAWGLVTLIRRYGGLRLERTLRPAFLGLVLGSYLPSGVFAIISALLGIAQPMG